MTNINVFKTLDKYIYDENYDGLLFVDNGKGLIQCTDIVETNKENKDGDIIYKVTLNKGRIINTVLANLYMFPISLEKYFMNPRKAFVDNCNVECINAFMYKDKVNVSEIIISSSSMSYLNGRNEISNRGEYAMSMTIFDNNIKYVYCIPVTKNYHKVELKAIAVYIMDNFYNKTSDIMKELNTNYCAIYIQDENADKNVLSEYKYVSGVKFNMLDSLYSVVPRTFKSRVYSYKDNKDNDIRNKFQLLNAERGYVDENKKRIYNEDGYQIYFIDKYKIISVSTGISVVINLNTNEEYTVYCSLTNLCNAGFIDYMLLDENKNKYILNYECVINNEDEDSDEFDLTVINDEQDRLYDLKNNLVKLIKRGNYDLAYNIMEECGYVVDDEIEVTKESLNNKKYEYDLNVLNLNIYEDEDKELDFVEFEINNYICNFYENGLFLVEDLEEDKLYALDHDCIIEDVLDIINSNDMETIRYYINEIKKANLV